MKQRSLLLLANAVRENVTQAFLEKQKSDLIQHILQADDEEREGDKLKVLNDGDGVKLLMDVYTSYVSDDDFMKFPKFMRDVDTLLYKARGNRGLTKEDRIAMEEEAERSKPSKKRGKKKSKIPSSDSSSSNNNGGDNSNNGDSSTNNEVTASEDVSQLDHAVAEFFSRHLSKAG